MDNSEDRGITLEMLDDRSPADVAAFERLVAGLCAWPHPGQASSPAALPPGQLAGERIFAARDVLFRGVARRSLGDTMAVAAGDYRNAAP